MVGAVGAEAAYRNSIAIDPQFSAPHFGKGLMQFISAVIMPPP